MELRFLNFLEKFKSDNQGMAREKFVREDDGYFLRRRHWLLLGKIITSVYSTLNWLGIQEY